MDGEQTQQVFPLEGGLSTSLAVGLGIVLAVEGAAIHLWVAERNQLLAWIITALNVATLLWIWRERRAGSLSRLVLDRGDVEIVVGRRLRCRFPLTTVASAEVATWRSVPDMAPDFMDTAKPLEPNVIVSLRGPAQTRLPLGVRKRVGRFGLRVADPDLVVRLLTGTSSWHASRTRVNADRADQADPAD